MVERLSTCPRCSAPTNPVAGFCPNCGAWFDSPVDPPVPAASLAKRKDKVLPTKFVDRAGETRGKRRRP